MKKYQVKIRDVVIEIEQDDDGKFIIPEFVRNYQSYGTQLKPAYEPIIVARKPVEISVINNVLKYRVGGINIDECRIGDEEISTHNAPKGTFAGGDTNRGSDTSKYYNHDGRFPANVIHDGSDEVTAGMPNSKSTGSDYDFDFGNQDNPSHLYTNIKSGQHFEDEGNASRYFYCAKASKKDRDEGLDEFEEKDAKELLGRTENSAGASWDGKYSSGNAFAGAGGHKKNIHPTVKPCELMQYLVRLVAPRGATILDCFNGSGSTGKAVMWENRERNADYKYIGIELTEEYLPISKARIDYVLDKRDQEIKQVEKNENGVEETKTYKIQTIFDF